MHKRLFALGLVLTTCTVASVPVNAQTSTQSQSSPQPVRTDPFFRTRAKNLARQAAEDFNGGLSNYRAESAMYGSALYAPHVENPDGSITFTFKGGPPGYTVPTLETSVTINTDRTIKINYNRSLQTGLAVAKKPSPPSSPTSSTSTSSSPAPTSPSPTSSLPDPASPTSAVSSASKPSQSSRQVTNSSLGSPQSQPKVIDPLPRPSTQTAPRVTQPLAPTSVQSPSSVTKNPVQPNTNGVRRLPSVPPDQMRPQPTPISPSQPDQPPADASSSLSSASSPISTPPTSTPSRATASPPPVGSTVPNTNAIGRSPGTDFLPRALNLARQAAEKQNGGISNYRAEPAMYSTPSQSPHVKNTDGSVTFTFKGGPPTTSSPYFTPTVESVVTVFQDGRILVNYNGLIRPGTPKN